MADITMCDDVFCSRAGQCYRFTAPISDYNQSWFIKSPLKEDKSCDEFIANDASNRRKQIG